LGEHTDTHVGSAVVGVHDAVVAVAVAFAHVRVTDAVLGARADQHGQLS
jgi:hypothetical protein